jgi:hypothetical protein
MYQKQDKSLFSIKEYNQMMLSKINNLYISIQEIEKET